MQKRIYSPQSERLLRQARQQAVAMGHSYVGSEHLLLSLTEAVQAQPGRLLRAGTGGGSRQYSAAFGPR